MQGLLLELKSKPRRLSRDTRSEKEWKHDEKIVTLAGDGIGPEIMAAGLQVLAAVAPKINFAYEVEAKHFGGAAIDAEGHQKQP